MLKPRALLHSLRSLKRFVGPQVWHHLVYSVLLGVCGFTVEALMIVVIQTFLLALGLPLQGGTFTRFFSGSSTTTALVLLLAFGALRAAVAYFRSINNGLIYQAFVRETRSRIFSKALKHAHDLSIAEVLTNFGDQLSQAGQVLMNLTRLASTLTATLLLCVLLGKISLILFFTSALLLALLFVPLRRLSRSTKEAGRSWGKSVQGTTSALLIGLKNHFLLRIYGQTSAHIQVGKDQVEESFAIYKKFLTNTSIQNTMPSLAGTVAVCILSLISLNMLRLSGTDLLSFLYIFMRLSQNLGEIMTSTATMRFGMPSLKAIMDWEEGLNSYPDSPLSHLDSGQPLQSLDTGSGPVEIQLHEVSFSYPLAKRDILSNINITVSPGTLFLIQGPSGSGKSTLLSLILGIQTPSAGRIQINGKPTTSIAGALYDRVAYVGPEPFLIEGSVRQNLLFGFPTSVTPPAELELWRALERAHLGPLVRSFARGIDENLDDFAKISTGQKQRLALSRAFLRNPRLLILDEATANLDPKTERSLVDEIGLLKGSTTIIVISHKEAFQRISDNHLLLGDAWSTGC